MSLFPFKNLNGIFKRLIHGTRYSELQMSYFISTFANLFILKSRLKPESAVNEFCKKIELSSKRRKNLQLIHGTNSYVYGKIKKTLQLRQDINDAICK